MSMFNLLKAIEAHIAEQLVSLYSVPSNVLLIGEITSSLIPVLHRVYANLNFDEVSNAVDIDLKIMEMTEDLIFATGILFQDIGIQESLEILAKLLSEKGLFVFVTVPKESADKLVTKKLVSAEAEMSLINQQVMQSALEGTELFIYKLVRHSLVLPEQDIGDFNVSIFFVARHKVPDFIDRIVFKGTYGELASDLANEKCEPDKDISESEKSELEIDEESEEIESESEKGEESESEKGEESESEKGEESESEKGEESESEKGEESESEKGEESESEKGEEGESEKGEEGESEKGEEGESEKGEEGESEKGEEGESEKGEEGESEEDKENESEEGERSEPKEPAEGEAEEQKGELTKALESEANERMETHNEIVEENITEHSDTDITEEAKPPRVERIPEYHPFATAMIDKANQLAKLKQSVKTLHDSCQEIMRTLSDPNQPQSTKRKLFADLKAKQEQHQTKLSEYAKLHEHHQSALDNFMRLHQEVLEQHPEHLDHYHELIYRHQRIQTQHMAEIDKQQNVAEQQEQFILRPPGF